LVAAELALGMNNASEHPPDDVRHR
jgi:hypothetical protein